MGSFGEMETENATGTVSSTRKILPLPPSAADLLCAAAPEKKLYWDRSHYDSPESQMKALCKSSTLYVGNLAFSTRSPHLNALFSTLGPVKEVNIGLDRFKKTACGFAFVEYVHRKDALDAVAYLSGTKLDGRVIRVELDAGFKPGREFGRGISGGQVSSLTHFFFKFCNIFMQQFCTSHSNNETMLRINYFIFHCTRFVMIDVQQ